MSYMSSTGVGKVPYTLGERFKPTARLEMSAESWDSLKLLLDRIMPARLWCRRLRLLRGPARLVNIWLSLWNCLLCSILELIL